MYSIFQDLFNKTELSTFVDSLVYTNEDGSYTLYSDYIVIPFNGKFKAKKHTTYTEYVFSSLKSALCWAIMDKRNLVVQANRVIELDILLEGAMAGVEYYTTKAKNATSLDTKSMYIIKLQESKYKKIHLMEELDEIAKSTRKWQYKKFEELK